MKLAKFALCASVFLIGISPAIANVADTTDSGDYAKFFKDKHFETVEGMMRLHKSEDKVYMEIPDSLCGRDFLLASTVSETSDNFNSIIGSKPFEPIHLKLERISDKLRFLKVENENISRHPGDNIDRALAANNIHPVFKTFDIKVFNPDSTSFIIDVTDLFCSDIEELSPFDPNSIYTQGKGKRNATFSKENSFICGIKAFEDNISIKSMMSYTFSVTVSQKDIVKDKAFSALMTRSLLLLDKEAARPRITDSRMSVFPSAVIVYDSESLITKPVYLAHRWKLEPEDPEKFQRGELTEPVKPIRFYIDSFFPERYRPYIKEGVEQWNEAFEQIGFKNAVEALDYPDTEEFDPDNVKFSCVRYAPTPIENSMGPSWIDPRSGEIISASVYIYHDVLKLLGKWLFAQTAQTDVRVRTKDIPEEVIGDALRYVVAHEVGHCLGFMHNMSGSANVPVDSLRSPSYTQKFGTTTSIMDYARFNYVAQPGDYERGVKLTPPRFGRYDIWALKWNYTPVFGVDDMWEEYSITSKWISEAVADSIYRYGKQQSTPLDPRSQNEDLGDDSVLASEYGVKNLKFILDNLESWANGKDPDCSFREMAYTAVTDQYMNYLMHVYANIGGFNLYERIEGDPVPDDSPVSAQRQRKAFGFLIKQLDDIEWIDNPVLISRLGLLEKPSQKLRNLLVQMLISCPEKVELAASRTVGDDSFTPSECLDRLCAHIWQPALENRIPTRNQMEVQRAFVKYLGEGAGMKIEFGKNSKNSYGEPSLAYFVPENKSALFYDKLNEAASITARAAKKCHSSEGRNHYELLNKLINKALQ